MGSAGRANRVAGRRSAAPASNRAGRRPAAAATPTRKVIVEFPLELLKSADRAASELSLNRSSFIRSAVEQFLEMLQKRDLERELAEGYRANAALDRRICEEFAYVDSENL